MDILKEKIDVASRLYNLNVNHISETLQVIEYAMFLLKNKAGCGYFGSFNGVNTQEYHSFTFDGEYSRPVRDDLFITDYDFFVSGFREFNESLKNIGSRWTSFDSRRANKIIYTSVMSVACCFDLWKSGSRKTPGTFFEIFMAAVLKLMIPDELFSKHIPLIDQLESDDESIDPSSVSTDIVIKSKCKNASVVIPLKITTRERIVQPFAQQRILDSYFGNGVYFSFLACISETQQDKK
ncbi:type II site-specific deoxyribonuclease, partial [Escherichia coli]